MLIGYIENGKALDNDWNPFFQKIDEGVFSEIQIYDDDDNLILQGDEKILSIRKDDKMDVHDDWRPRQGMHNLAFSGYLYSGDTIITNKRILHYRIPDPNWAGSGKPHHMGIPDVLLAREAKKRSMLEFFQMNFSDVVKVSIVRDRGPEYCSISDFKRFNIHQYKKKNVDEFPLIEPFLKSGEVERKIIKDGFKTEIYYVEPSFILDIKKHWKRDDLLKKARKYERKKKFEKAILKYQKMLEIFPDDESSKQKIEELSNAK